MRRFVLWVHLCGLPFWLGQTASAVTIPWAGQTTLVLVDDGGVYSGTLVGDAASGSFDYSGVCPGDCLVEPFPPDETNYVFPSGAASITLGGITTNGSESSVNIQDDHALTADEADFANLFLGGSSVMQGDVIDVWTAASQLGNLEWEISFVSLDASFFGDQAFQAAPPGLSEPDFAIFQIVEVDDQNEEIFHTAGVLVPEPSTVSLLALALASLAALRGRTPA